MVVVVVMSVWWQSREVSEAYNDSCSSSSSSSSSEGGGQLEARSGGEVFFVGKSGGRGRGAARLQRRRMIACAEAQLTFLCVSLHQVTVAP